MDRYEEAAEEYLENEIQSSTIKERGGLARAFRWFSERERATCETCAITPCAIYDVTADADPRVHEETFGCIYHRRIVEVPSEDHVDR